MRKPTIILFIIFIISIMIPGSCIEQFIPETDEDLELLVVEGLITDQNEENIIKLSMSLPLGRKKVLKPLKGCLVSITDDRGQYYALKEKTAGTYVTNPATFRGATGRKYRLNIDTRSQSISGNHLYESAMMEMLPVPSIDTVYYKKEVIIQSELLSELEEGCRIYLSTSDKTDKCRYYRWDYAETWEFRLPFGVPNRVCWITENSKKIDIRSTAAMQVNKVTDYPLLFISNTTDRLRVKYSMMVNQYSLSEDEFQYWEKLQNISQNVGTLYDIIPANVPSNISCRQDPSQKVLGYFSVSARSSKRIFIREHFYGVINLYTNCISDTIYGTGPISGLNQTVWVIMDASTDRPPYRVVTEDKNCADCTTRGTTTEPSFWRDDEN